MLLTHHDLYRFDEFELQPSRRLLLRQGQKIAIAPKSFEVLLCLVQRAGRVVLKEELLKTVWPDSFVEESNLTQHIFWLRKALADKAEYIVTIPGRGYEFTGQVQALAETEPAVQTSTVEVAAGVRVRHSSEITRVTIEDTVIPVGRLAPQSAPRPAWLLKALITGGSLAMLAAASVGAWKWRHRAVPGDHHEIVLADFDNSTGDPDFDRALKTLLIFDLNQSPFLAVASDSDARKTLKLMNRPPDSDLTPPVAREVCERLNDQAVIGGLIARLGQKYLVTLSASDCSTGQDLVEVKKVAENRDGVIAAVDSAAAEVRSRLGEPLHKLGPSEYLPPVHTYSLEALKLFSQARQFHYKTQFKEAAALYQRAIDLDPKFTTAYAQLANCYNNLGEQSLGMKAMEKAYELRDLTDGPDRLRITTMYQYWKNGNRHIAIENYRTWTKSYPRSAYPWILLGEFEDSVGNRSAAIEAEKQAIALDPLQLSAYVSLATYQLSDGRFDDLKETCRKAASHGYESPDLHRQLLNAAFFQNDSAALQQERAWLKRKGSDEDQDEAEADLDLVQGKIHAGLTLLLRQVEAARKEGREQAALERLATVVEIEADLGMVKEARAHLEQLRPMPAVNAEAVTNIVQADAATGNVALSEKELARMLDKNKLDSDVSEFFAPEARAAIALARSRPLDAVTALQPALGYAYVYPSVSDLLGRAYLAAHQPEPAARQFRLILDRPYGYMGPGLAMAHLRLARALEMQGDHMGSRQEYDSLLRFWKDADTDLKLMKDARNETKAILR